MFNKYPFVRGARTLATPSTSLLYTETTFSYFNRLLLGPVFTIENTPKIEVNIFMNCIVILKKMDSSFITRTFISNYAKRFEYFMLQDISNKTIRDEVMDYVLNVDFEIEYNNDSVLLKIPNYLQITSGIPGVEFKLVNQDVKKGIVSIRKRQFVLLLRYKLENLLLDKINKMKSIDGIEISDFDKYIELDKKYTPPILNKTVNSGLQPPCIKFLFSKIDNEHHLTHNERLLISTYMFSKGYNIEWLVDNIFRKLSDWNERITRYQLNYIKEHKIMNCDKIENQGMCKKSEDRLNKCGFIKNPFQF